LIRYAESLLRQENTLRKRQVMRFLAMNFFHDAEIHEVQYQPRTQSIRVLVRNVMAVNDACRLQSCNRRIRRLQRLDFLYCVRFLGVTEFRIVSSRKDRPCPFATYGGGEVSDWRDSESERGLTVLRASSDLGSRLRLVFRDVIVEPLRPARLKRYFKGTKGPTTGLLSARDPRRSLKILIASWKAILKAER